MRCLLLPSTLGTALSCFFLAGVDAGMCRGVDPVVTGVDARVCRYTDPVVTEVAAWPGMLSQTLPLVSCSWVLDTDFPRSPLCTVPAQCFHWPLYSDGEE